MKSHPFDVAFGGLDPSRRAAKQLDDAVGHLRGLSGITHAQEALRAASASAINPAEGLVKDLGIRGTRIAAAALAPPRWTQPPHLAAMGSMTRLFQPPALLRWSQPWLRPPRFDEPPRVAHPSAPDEIAEIMQRLAGRRSDPRTRGLARKFRTAWDRAYEEARERSRQAIAALTGRRAHIDPRYRRPCYQPYARDGPHPARTTVLPYRVVSYVITELLIRAPQFAAFVRRPKEHTSGDQPWLTSRPMLTSRPRPIRPTMTTEPTLPSLRTAA